MQSNTPARRTILLADDNPGLLQTLVEVLHAYEIAGTVGNGKAVLECVGALRPDLIVLDISLGDMNGFDVTRRLRTDGCASKIIFLTVHEDMEFIRAAIDLGASGYIFKSRIGADLTKAIDIVFKGGHFTFISSPLMIET
jgi:DNA-binding NarL/FixJ family response regulator